MAMAAAGNPVRFVTLTINPSVGTSPAERLGMLSHAWRTLVKRARRRWPKQTLDYLAIVEATQLGEPHLHILVRGPYMPQKWISSVMRELVNSPIVDIRKIKSLRHVVAYVAKYITKAPAQFGDAKRYWCTQTWEGSKKKKDDPATKEPHFWTVEGASLLELVARWSFEGWACRADSKGGIYAVPGRDIGGYRTMSP